MNRKPIARRLETLSYVMILLGFIGMVQPFAMPLYTYGFSVVLVGVILLNIVVHY